MAYAAFLIARQCHTRFLRRAQTFLDPLQIVGVLIRNHRGRTKLRCVSPFLIQSQHRHFCGFRMRSVGCFGKQEHDFHDRAFGIVAIRAKAVGDGQRLPAPRHHIGEKHIFDQVERF